MEKLLNTMHKLPAVVASECVKRLEDGEFNDVQKWQIFYDEFLPSCLDIDDLLRHQYIARIAKPLGISKTEIDKAVRMEKQKIKNLSPVKKDIIDFGGWLSKLKRDDNNKVCNSPANVIIILNNDPKLKDKFSYDTTIGAAFKAKGLPWSERDDKYSAASKKKLMSDGDYKSLYNYFHNCYGITNISIVENAFAEFCMSIQENPLLDFLNSLRWDGVPRLDTLLVDYFKAENTPYVRAVTRKTLVALVRRAYQPGVKFDTCLILKGVQGIGKSTLFSVLGGIWYTDAIVITNDSAKTFESHRGKWLCEMGELVSLKKTEAERLKSFFVAQVDRYRPPYGKNVMDIPRTSVTVGTTNSDQFLKDVTGNRRYWPVRVYAGGTKNVFRDLVLERDQIIAEAKAAHESGEPIYLPDELEKVAAGIQSEFVIEDAWTDRISNYLEIALPLNWMGLKDYERLEYIDHNKENLTNGVKRDRISTEIIFSECLHGEIERLTPQVATRIRDIMSQLPNWTKTAGQIRIPGYGKHKGWERH